jgi:hypothetical protein
VRRTWLHGLDSKRPALLLSFAAGGAPFEGEHVVGSVVTGALAFHPGPLALRAVAAAELPITGHLEALPGADRVGDVLDAHAAALGASPWLDRWPCALASVTPARRADGGWAVVDEEGAALPLSGPDPWGVLALSGGRPLGLFGEWRAGALRPLWAIGAEGSVRA